MCRAEYMNNKQLAVFLKVYDNTLSSSSIARQIWTKAIRVDLKVKEAYTGYLILLLIYSVQYSSKLSGFKQNIVFGICG